MLDVFTDIEKAAPPKHPARGGKYTRREWTGDRWKYYYDEDKKSEGWNAVDAPGEEGHKALQENAKKGVPEDQTYDVALAKASDTLGEAVPVRNPAFDEVLSLTVVDRKGKRYYELRDSDGSLLSSDSQPKGFASPGHYEAWFLGTSNTQVRYDKDGKPWMEVVPNVGNVNKSTGQLEPSTASWRWKIQYHRSVPTDQQTDRKALSRIQTLEGAKQKVDKSLGGTGEDIDFPSEPLSEKRPGDSGVTQDIETGEFRWRTGAGEDGKPKRELDVSDDEKRALITKLSRDYWPMLESNARKKVKASSSFYGEEKQDQEMWMERIIGDRVPENDERDEHGKPMFVALDPDSYGYSAIERAVDSYDPSKGPLAGWMSVAIDSRMSHADRSLKDQIKREGTSSTIEGEDGLTSRADITADPKTEKKRSESEIDFDTWRQAAMQMIEDKIKDKEVRQKASGALGDIASAPVAVQQRLMRDLSQDLLNYLDKSLTHAAIECARREEFTWKALQILSKDKNVDPAHQYLGTEGDESMPRHYFQDPSGNYVRYTNAPSGHPDQSNYYGDAALHPAEPTMESAPEYFTPDGMKLSRCPECDASQVEWNEGYDRYDPQNMWAGRWQDEAGNYSYTYVDADIRNMPKLNIHQQNAFTDVRIPVLRQGYSQMFNTSDRIKDQMTALCLALLDQGRFRAVELATLCPQNVMMEGPLITLGGRKIYADSKVHSALETLLSYKQPDEPLFTIPMQNREGKLDDQVYRRIGPHYLARVLDLQGLSLVGIQTYHATICFVRDLQRMLQNFDASWDSAKSHALLTAALEWGHDLQMEPDAMRVMQLIEQVLVDPIVIEVLQENAMQQGLIGSDTQPLPPAMPPIPSVSMDLISRTPEEEEFNDWIHTVPMHSYAGDVAKAMVGLLSDQGAKVDPGKAPSQTSNGGVLGLFHSLREEEQTSKGVLGLFDLIKHKYTRREGSPGNYKYFYDTDGGTATSTMELTEEEANAKAEHGDTINGKPFEEQLALAREVVGQHNERFNGLMQELQEIAPNGVVQGRVKTTGSAVGKLVRKPDMYKTANDLWDATGTRITLGSVDEVRDAVAQVRAKYKVVSEEDYISSPQGDYRSHHLAIEDSDGLMKEVQIRTENQDTWANWFHDIYKPITPEQAQWKEQHGDEIDAYATQMSSYFWAADTAPPDPGPPPQCPQVVEITFGCLS